VPQHVAALALVGWFKLRGMQFASHGLEEPSNAATYSMLVAVKATLLTGAVWITGAATVGVVRPFPLNFPLCPIGKTNQRDIERPGALVAVLLALGVVPRTRAGRIGPCLRQFVSANVS